MVVEVGGMWRGCSEEVDEVPLVKLVVLGWCELSTHTHTKSMACLGLSGRRGWKKPLLILLSPTVTIARAEGCDVVRERSDQATVLIRGRVTSTSDDALDANEHYVFSSSRSAGQQVSRSAMLECPRRPLLGVWIMLVRWEACGSRSMVEMGNFGWSRGLAV